MITKLYPSLADTKILKELLWQIETLLKWSAATTGGKEHLNVDGTLKLCIIYSWLQRSSKQTWWEFTINSHFYSTHRTWLHMPVNLLLHSNVTFLHYTECQCQSRPKKQSWSAVSPACSGSAMPMLTVKLLEAI